MKEQTTIHLNAPTCSLASHYLTAPQAAARLGIDLDRVESFIARGV